MVKYEKTAPDSGECKPKTQAGLKRRLRKTGTNGSVRSRMPAFYALFKRGVPSLPARWRTEA